MWRAAHASFPTPEDLHGVLEYQTDFTQFQAVSSLTLFFPTNHNGDGATEIWYVGLRRGSRPFNHACFLFIHSLESQGFSLFTVTLHTWSTRGRAVVERDENIPVKAVAVA